jgi:adenylate cyclase
MQDPKGTASDAFRASLVRLLAPGAALESVLQGLRALRQQGGQGVAPELVEGLAALQRDLVALQSGSRRAVRQVEQLQGLIHTSAVVTSSLDIDHVLEEVMDNAIKLTNAERAYLMLRAEGGEALELRAARNWDRETLAEEEITVSHGVMSTVLETGEPVLTINAQGDQRFQEQASVLIHDLRSIICIPLKLRDRVTGVLYADNRFEQGVFDEESVALVATFANFAAIAIDNARHFQRVSADLAAAKLEVSRLRIEIDQRHVSQELDKITETDFFQRLETLARDVRSRRRKPD